jgi:hypothetical protein
VLHPFVVTVRGAVMLFLMLNVLYIYISTAQSMYAVPSMAVFCRSLILCFTSMLLRYCLNVSELVPVASIIIVLLLVSLIFTSHMHSLLLLPLPILPFLLPLPPLLNYLIFLQDLQRRFCIVMKVRGICLTISYDSLRGYLPQLFLITGILGKAYL